MEDLCEVWFQSPSVGETPGVWQASPPPVQTVSTAVPPSLRLGLAGAEPAPAPNHSS